MAWEPDRVHVALDPNGQQIRLLNLFPGEGDEPIVWQLKVDSLHRSPHYETLSYVWGTAKADELLVINGHDFQITANLLLAMRRIRLRTQPRELWIDQLCIDQSDHEEKATRIAMMGDIFSRATRGLFWLGELDLPVNDGLKYLAGDGQFDTGSGWKDVESDDEYLAPDVTGKIFEDSAAEHLIPVAFSSLTRLARANPSDHEPAYEMAVDLEHGTDVMRLPVEAVLKVMGSSWWRRIWTLQECVLSYHALVIYGPYTIPWGKFLQAGVYLHQHSTACCAKAFKVIPLGLARQLATACAKLQEIQNLQTLILARTRITPQQLIQHLIVFQHREATDPRDKVFGLLGLVFPWPGLDHFTINPGLPTAEVYKKIAYKLILETGTLDVMPHRVLTSELSDLPSWDKGWSVSATSTDLHSQTLMFPHNVCGETEAEVSWEFGIPGSINVKGIPIANVIWTSTAAYTTPGLWIATYRQWLTEFNSPIGSMLPDYNPFHHWEPRSEEFLTLICGHTAPYSGTYRGLSEVESDPLELKLPVEAKTNANGSGDPNNAAQDDSWNSIVEPTTWQRRLFGIDGLLGRRQLLSCGLGPSDMRQGDLVCILHGGKLPVVLRPIKRCPVHPPRLHYRYLGTCFLEYEASQLQKLFEETIKQEVFNFTLV